MVDRPRTRLFHDGALSAGSLLRLDEAASHHALRVLRLPPGSDLEIFNGQGLRWPGRLAQVHEGRALVELGEPVDAATESPLNVHLAQCLPVGDKMDWVVEKAVELGVRSIQPLSARRSVLRLEGDRALKRQAHWQRIAIAACMQCGRDRLPVIEPLATLPAWLETQESGAGAQVGAQGADATVRRWVLTPGAPELATAPPVVPSSIWLLVGPEGGLDGSEIDAARRAGFVPLALGPRVLRTETAGLAALAALQVRFGDFAGLR